MNYINYYFYLLTIFITSVEKYITTKEKMKKANSNETALKKQRINNN